MKIGIYSGCFDPFTNGHAWIVEESLKLFDRLYLVVGRHPQKQQIFTTGERVGMVRSCFPDKRILVDAYGENEDILIYANDLAKDHADGSISIIRGMRDEEDFNYEANICRHMRRRGCKFPMFFLVPPDHLISTSSSFVKDLCEDKAWDVVESCVPAGIAKKLKEYYGQWEDNGPVASMFETTTAGFAPAPTERGVCMWSTSGHKLELVDHTESPLPDQPVLRHSEPKPVRKVKEFFYRIAKNGFIKFAKKVSGNQVREMLDPFPVDVVVSDTFHLMRINVDSIKSIGDRYLSYSRSLGPIIVDANLVLGDKYGLGPVVIIEGKHRWLDAKARGEKTIWAWVGEKAIDRLKNGT